MHIYNDNIYTVVINDFSPFNWIMQKIILLSIPAILSTYYLKNVYKEYFLKTELAAIYSVFVITLNLTVFQAFLSDGT